VNSTDHIAISMIQRDEFVQRFLVARGKAVQEYAEYEQSLAGLYAYLTGMERDIAGVTFFKLSQARARIAILERLLHKKHGAKYNPFWNSLVKHMDAIDRKRNEIVHWGTVVHIGLTANGVQTNTLALEPPNFWDRTEGTPSIWEDDLYDFIVKVDYFARAINMFLAVMTGVPLDALPTWQEIFLQPITYPPPDTHPLCRKRPAP
jgi:hypothetical protein